MKKSLLLGSMLAFSLVLTACGESLAEKEQKERESSSRRMAPVKMPEVGGLVNEANSAKPKNPTSPPPEIKLGEPVVPATKK